MPPSSTLISHNLLLQFMVTFRNDQQIFKSISVPGMKQAVVKYSIMIRHKNSKTRILTQMLPVKKERIYKNL